MSTTYTKNRFILSENPDISQRNLGGITLIKAYSWSLHEASIHDNYGIYLSADVDGINTYDSSFFLILFPEDFNSSDSDLTLPVGPLSQEIQFLLGVDQDNFDYSDSFPISFPEGSILDYGCHLLYVNMELVYAVMVSNLPTESSGSNKSYTFTLESSGWSNSQYQITVQGLTSSDTVFVSPYPGQEGVYTENGIYCSSQYNNLLTFTCSTTPSVDVDVNVAVFKVKEEP